MSGRLDTEVTAMYGAHVIQVCSHFHELPQHEGVPARDGSREEEAVDSLVHLQFMK